MLRSDHLTAADLDDLILLQDALSSYSDERPSDHAQITRLSAVLQQAISSRHPSPDPQPLARVFF